MLKDIFTLLTFIVYHEISPNTHKIFTKIAVQRKAKTTLKILKFHIAIFSYFGQIAHCTGLSISSEKQLPNLT